MANDLRATYRVQLSPAFTFDDAAALADYLRALGVSHMYCSPYLQAAQGSTHGYDVVDPTRVNEELGGAAGHARLCAALEEHELGQILDIVPNHMAIDAKQNAWWWNVLENGQSSPFAAYFDVDWDPPESRLRNRVLMPVLGDQYGRVLEALELQLQHKAGNFTVHYYDHVLPVSPRSQHLLLRAAAERIDSDELLFIADKLRELPRGHSSDLQVIERRRRDTAVLRGQFKRLCQQQPEVVEAVDAVVAGVNGEPDQLHELLELQNYRLAHWKTVQQDLGYRRFFDINSLAALNVDDARVFEHTHTLVLQWLRDGTIDGVRIDHPDGLRDPEGYFRRLRDTAPRAYLVVEKILEHGERVPRSWPISGTTGYEFLNGALRVLVDPRGEEALTRLYESFTGRAVDWPELVRQRKLQVMEQVLGGDLNRLAELLLNVCEQDRRYRDFTRQQVTEVLREVAACMPIYRTYVRANIGMVSTADEQCIRNTVKRAKQHRPDLDAALFDFFRDILLLRTGAALEAELVMRFQQFTGPVMAKSVEDTAFYCFHRLVALNEVGGDPSQFAVNVEAFHGMCEETQTHHPASMLSTSTHDTKRSEDVRARLAVLSEVPERWEAAVTAWAEHNERYRQDARPDRNAEYLLYQTMVGAWPLSRERAWGYMEKAVREAKEYTSWTEQNEQYEEALRLFIEHIYDDSEFVEQVEAFADSIAEAGFINSLAQTLLKLTAPGVPDVYQGNELWDFSLVDPDNRRAVDFDARRALLTKLDDLAPAEIWAQASAGMPKLWVVREALRVRRERAASFGPAGRYAAVETRGSAAAHVVAFARGDDVVTVVPRLTARFEDQAASTEVLLPAGAWRNVLGGGEACSGATVLKELFDAFPVALLVREAE